MFDQKSTSYRQGLDYRSRAVLTVSLLQPTLETSRRATSIIRMEAERLTWQAIPLTLITGSTTEARAWVLPSIRPDPSAFQVPPARSTRRSPETLRLALLEIF